MQLRSKLATMLKIGCVTNVFLGTWPKFTEHLFSQTFFDVFEAKPHPVVFFNHLILVVAKGHTYLNKPGSLS